MLSFCLKAHVTEFNTGSFGMTGARVLPILSYVLVFEEKSSD